MGGRQSHGEKNQRGDCTNLPEISNSMGKRSLCGNVRWLARIMIKLMIEKGKRVS